MLTFYDNYFTSSNDNIDMIINSEKICDTLECLNIDKPTDDDVLSKIDYIISDNSTSTREHLSPIKKDESGTSIVLFDSMSEEASFSENQSSTSSVSTPDYDNTMINKKPKHQDDIQNTEDTTLNNIINGTCGIVNEHFNQENKPSTPRTNLPKDDHPLVTDSNDTQKLLQYINEIYDEMKTMWRELLLLKNASI